LVGGLNHRNAYLHSGGSPSQSDKRDHLASGTRFLPPSDFDWDDAYAVNHYHGALNLIRAMDQLPELVSGLELAFGIPELFAKTGYLGRIAGVGLGGLVGSY
jgi:hypothetical protein